MKLLALSFGILNISWIIIERKHFLRLVLLLLHLLIVKNFLLFGNESLIIVLTFNISIHMVLV